MKKLLLIILISTLTSCNGYNFYDILASLGAESPNIARDLSFADNNYLADQINGDLKFSPALSESNITEYRVYLGNSPSTKNSSTPVAVITPNGSMQSVSISTPLTGETHLLIYSVNGTNEMSVCASLQIKDLVVKMFADIYTGAANSSNPAGFTVINDILYFAANSGNGLELHKSDGTVAGTSPVPNLVDLFVGGDGFATGSWIFGFNNKLIFCAQTSLNNLELWVYDPSSAPSGPAYTNSTNPALIEINGIGASTPSKPINLNGKLYFSANDGTNGRQLWEFDPANSVSAPPYNDIAGSNPKLINIYPGGASIPENLIIYNNKLYFSATDGTTGIELWELTPAATYSVGINLILINIATGALSSTPKDFAVYNNKLYFQASQTATTGTELWVLDTNSPNTISADPYNALPTSNPKLFDIIPGAVGSVPQGMMVLNNKLIFAADDIIHGRELWTSDGTAAGTYLIRDLTTGAATSVFSAYVYGSHENYFIFNDKLYMNLNVSGDTELVITDGTYSGTSFNNIFTGPGNSSNPKYFASLNGMVYFVADDSTGEGPQILRSNGVDAGTVQMTDISLFSNGVIPPKELIEYKGKIFFQGTSDNATPEAELWELYYK